ncbi:alpha/beta hydrolase [Corynebacterium pseudodiphtheriticum]|uniref:alpha/beta hydrolase n=1 Tax=Corynebacterium pseudodiphtheriticum TaxID=37637 RepID=UPI00254F6780|nr:alpha/beta hydrolase [Corynebacterium pseudodiphtheriticum]MDK8699885.1 alpha/beta hydrolase [Corynebacterium pseudodiphtheriticum]MDK8775429.1 alpha/beta hydrolase [Corynebacterium pseudodiphtheriticum]
MYSQNTTTSQEMFAAADGIRSRASALEADQQQFSGSLASMVGLDFDGAAAQSGISRAREIIESITTATRAMHIVAGIVESFAGQMEWAERLERIATAAVNATPAGPVLSHALRAIQLIGKSIDAACALSIEAACFGSQHLPHRFGDFMPSALGGPHPDGAIDLSIDDIHTIQACRAPDPLLAQTVDHPDLRLLEVTDKHWAGMVGPPPEETDNLVVFVPGVGSDGNDSIGGQIERARTQAAAMGGTGLIYGYDAPDRLLSGTSSGAAHTAGPQLREFLADVDQRYPNHHVTVVGYSYGSVIVGNAASGETPMRADDVLFVGSPGTGLDSVDEMNLRGDNPQVHAARRALDPVSGMAYSNGGLFGVNPAAPTFGAHPWPGDGMRNHSGFFDDAAYLDGFAELARHRGLTGPQ